MSQNLPQNGTDNQGIHGFLINDIINYIKTKTHHKCKVCNKIGATLKCEKCADRFHLKCLWTSGGCPQFKPSYTVRCKKHYTPPPFNKNTLYNDTCGICLEVAKKQTRYLLPTPCCRINVLHLSCARVSIFNLI